MLKEIVLVLFRPTTENVYFGSVNIQFLIMGEPYGKIAKPATSDFTLIKLVEPCLAYFM